VLDVAGVAPDWKMEDILNEAVEAIREQVRYPRRKPEKP